MNCVFTRVIAFVATVLIGGLFAPAAVFAKDLGQVFIHVVSQSGEPVTDPSASDFVVMEDQVECEIVSAEKGTEPMKIAQQVQTLFIEPASPWENSYVESFNGKLRDELLNHEIFYTLTEAKILIERWRREYNTVRPHRALGYRPPAPEVISPAPLSGRMMSPALS